MRSEGAVAGTQIDIRDTIVRCNSAKAPVIMTRDTSRSVVAGTQINIRDTLVRRNSAEAPVDDSRHSQEV